MTKEEALKKMLEMGDGKTWISSGKADAILVALGKNPRDYFAADVPSVNLNTDVLNAERIKSTLVDGGFATVAEVETAKTSLITVLK